MIYLMIAINTAKLCRYSYIHAYVNALAAYISTLGYPKHGGENIKVVKINCNLLHGGYMIPW